MLEYKGNLFDYLGDAQFLFITTNGFVKKDGTCVMGKGCALEAVRRWPCISSTLGKAIKERGNKPHALFQRQGTWICSFPVKPVSDIFDGRNAVKHMLNRFTIGQTIPGWACLADLQIIERSAAIIAKIAAKPENAGWNKIVLPRPGCGAGELTWEEVKPVLDKYFDNRFVSVTY